MRSYFLGAFLIFGLGHPTREPLDTSKGVPLHSRIPCDGQTAPEDQLRVQATFSSGSLAREFVVSRFRKEGCQLDLKGKCLHKERQEWRDVWTAASDQPSATLTLPLDSCYAWHSTEGPQYVLSGWYREEGAKSKVLWKQATVKQDPSHPQLWEFTDPSGATARLEVTGWW